MTELISPEISEVLKMEYNLKKLGCAVLCVVGLRGFVCCRVVLFCVLSGCPVLCVVGLCGFACC